MPDAPIVDLAKRALRAKTDDGREYVESRADVPEGFEAHEGPQGGIYYYPDGRQGGGSGDGSGEGSEATADTGDPEPGASDAPEDDGDEADGNTHDPSPEVDIERFQTDDEVNAALERTNEEPREGFTLHRDLQIQPLGSEDVWTVGAASTNHTDELTKEDVLEVYKEYQEVLEETTGLRLGGYHFEEGGKFSVDVNLALTDREEAIEVGKRLGQEGVFNIGTEEYIGTGGDGESPITSPDELREFVSEVDSLSEKRRKMMAKERDLNEYENDDGDRLNFYQIAMLGAKEGKEVEDVEDGFEVDGDLYRRVEADTAEKLAESAVERIQGQGDVDDAGN
jgi:hypothetical protein